MDPENQKEKEEQDRKDMEGDDKNQNENLQNKTDEQLPDPPPTFRTIRRIIRGLIGSKRDEKTND